MGTPEFAVASLKKLSDYGCNIIAVITAPDKPGGRGMEMQQSAVKKCALELGIPVLQPEKLKHPVFIETLRSLHADLQVVVAFRMLPEIVWNMPPLGSVNLHGSLLPKYRGAAPINWAIINGETETGVTTFKLQHEIDTGNILLQQSFPITETDTAGTVHDKMMNIGAGVLLDTIVKLGSGMLEEQPQVIEENNKSIPHAPKIFPETCNINFMQSVESVYNLIRGLSPFPAAFTTLEGKKLKIFSSEKNYIDLKINPGEFTTDGKSYLRFGCSDGSIDVKELQLEGKKKMKTEEFLNGYRFKM